MDVKKAGVVNSNVSVPVQLRVTSATHVHLGWPGTYWLGIRNCDPIETTVTVDALLEKHNASQSAIANLRVEYQKWRVRLFDVWSDCRKQNKHTVEEKIGCRNCNAMRAMIWGNMERCENEIYHLDEPFAVARTIAWRLAKMSENANDVAVNTLALPKTQ